ncbi:MFS transporter [Streptomyces sp. NPDC051784]|uniref:MFS transporter n=1 Tax=Streptomyces sp. NPDC051784 TaxID=3155805 RepID=UPI0034203526
MRSRVGLLVTVYAFTVGLTATPLTHCWTAAWLRKRLYMTVSTVFSLGTVLSAAAESYPMPAIGRFLCGMAHGVFWSIVAGYAAALAKPGRSSRTTAVVFAGSSTALVLGVPLGNVLGNLVGWRGAFCTAAALIPPPPIPFDLTTMDQASIAFRTVTGPAPDAEAVNTPQYRRAELGAINGHTNARGLLALLRAVTLGGAADGVRLLSEATVERIFQVQAERSAAGPGGGKPGPP